MVPTPPGSLTMQLAAASVVLVASCSTLMLLACGRHGNAAEAPNTQLTGNVLSTALSKNVVAVGATDNYSPVMIGIATLLAANDSMLTIPSRFMSPAQYAVKAKPKDSFTATCDTVNEAAGTMPCTGA
ncbi:hypothetical protein HaLaN_15576 [Haematococcus lacustris]|uniref:Uncharacterized protein n=1 Tax=Haematococcus lacustris TaxID=44745 RepID=A0A699ZAM1_HAELA|nr:hypothetical protein HaLaN_15576 [Haematococcus lacustris]